MSQLSLPTGSGLMANLTRNPVTAVIILICVGVWIGELVVPGFYQFVVLTPALGALEPWRFITSAFAHATNLTHILFNMMALWLLGPGIEHFVGKARYVALYLLSAVGGGVVFVLMTPDTIRGWNTGVVGASGAIFGLFGAMAVLQRLIGQDNRSLWVLILANTAIGFLVPGIAWQAHLGGFLCGLLAAVVIIHCAKQRARGLRDYTWLQLGMLGALIVAAAVVRYQLAL